MSTTTTPRRTSKPLMSEFKIGRTFFKADYLAALAEWERDNAPDEQVSTDA